VVVILQQSKDCMLNLSTWKILFSIRMIGMLLQPFCQKNATSSANNTRWLLNVIIAI
jgi:hypothetical protein